MALGYLDALLIAQAVKEASPGTMVVFGGPQATATAAKTLGRFKQVDLIVRGEADATIGTIFKHVLSGDLTALAKIGGVSYRPRQGKIVHAERSGQHFDLGLLPAIIQHPDSTEKTKNILVEVGRGCFGKCIYCATTLFWQDYGYRMRPIGSIMQEIHRHLRVAGPTKISFEFMHDCFTQNRRWVQEFLTEMRKLRSSGVNFEWRCSSRPDSIDGDMMSQMRRGGCSRLFFGIESGSTTTQRKTGKGLDPEAAFRTLKLATETGLHAVASFIVGFPWESATDINATLTLATRLAAVGASSQVHMLTAFPGTRLASEARLAHAGVYSNLVTYPDGAINRIRQTAESMEKVVARNQDIFPHYCLPVNEHGIQPRFLQFLENVFPEIARHFPRSLIILSRISGRTIFQLAQNMFASGKLGGSQGIQSLGIPSRDAVKHALKSTMARVGLGAETSCLLACETAMLPTEANHEIQVLGLANSSWNLPEIVRILQSADRMEIMAQGGAAPMCSSKKTWSLARNQRKLFVLEMSLADDQRIAALHELFGRVRSLRELKAKHPTKMEAIRIYSDIATACLG